MISSSHKIRALVDTSKEIKVWVLAPFVDTKDEQIDYYYDFSQSIEEYTRVFNSLELKWIWQPVNMNNYKEVVENIVEEIVGQIDDEHDVPLESSFFQIKKIDEKTYHFGGRVELKKFEEIFKIKFEDCLAETVGGLVMATFKAVPKIGDKIEKSQLIFKVLDADKRMVKAVEVKALYSF